MRHDLTLAGCRVPGAGCRVPGASSPDHARSRGVHDVVVGTDQSRMANGRAGNLRHLAPNGDDWTTTATLDLSFWDWRSAFQR